MIENEEILSSSNVVGESRHVESVVDAGGSGRERERKGGGDQMRTRTSSSNEKRRELLERELLSRRRNLSKSLKSFRIYRSNEKIKRVSQRTRTNERDERRGEERKTVSFDPIELTEIRQPIHVGRFIEQLDPDDVGDLYELLSKEGKDVDRLSHVGW